MYAAIKDKVDDLLAQAQVTFTVRYVGEITKSEGRDTPWQCDAWRFTLKGNGRQYDGDYFTGLGHRVVCCRTQLERFAERSLVRLVLSST